jgi:beta-phosphoglucomutase family hydrolase
VGLSGIGAIFDWDGVIVDSSAQHEQAWEGLATEVGLALPADHFERGFGLKNERIIPDILGWTRDEGEIRRLSLRKEALYRVALRERGIALLPGVASFLAVLRRSGIPCAVGSSSHRENIEVALELLELDAFEAVVTAEDVSAGKPDPEVFLLAAGRIGVPPGRCVVFEDVPAGIEAAHRGGMKAVAVTTTHPAAALTRADLVVDRLDGLSPDSLQVLIDSEPATLPGSRGDRS